jgi:hypothetical protein
MHRTSGSLSLLVLLLAASPAFACVGAQQVDPCTGRPRVTPRPSPVLLGTPAPDAASPATVVAVAPPDTFRKPVPPPRLVTTVDTTIAERNRAALRLGAGRLGRGVRSGPAGSISVPTGLGVSAGEGFVGVGFQERTRYTTESDAGAVIGIGFGDTRTAALEVALSSYSTIRSAPFATGGVSARLHRRFGDHLAAAAGWENVAHWGGADAQSSLYAAATQLVRLREEPREPLSSLALTLGVGNGRFRREADDAAERQAVNVFGAVGVRVLEPLALVAEWTGQDVTAGVSLTPMPRVPLVVTAGFADLTGSAGDGARFILSVGYGFAVPWRI